MVNLVVQVAALEIKVVLVLVYLVKEIVAVALVTKMVAVAVEKLQVVVQVMVVQEHQAQLNQQHSLLAVAAVETVVAVVLAVLAVVVRVVQALQQVKLILAVAAEAVPEMTLLRLNQVVVELFKSNYQLRDIQDKLQAVLKFKHQEIKQF
jgi:hypothetical protein